MKLPEDIRNRCLDLGIEDDDIVELALIVNISINDAAVWLCDDVELQLIERANHDDFRA